MEDCYGRKIDYMRISITDRCNLRCRYCMPEGIELVPMEEILSYEEIELICRAAVACGITKFKITGGEPLVRKGCPQLIGRIKKIPGVDQVTLTTNGVLLEEYVDELSANGLDGVNVSLDTLNPKKFYQITGADKLCEVRRGMDQALRRGLNVKVNCVLQKGMNDSEWKDILELARKQTLHIRFIELMPIGPGRMEQMISGKELLKRMENSYPGIEKDTTALGNGPAAYWKIPGFAGSIGLISALHGKFCEECNRIRLTARGELKPCLCFGESVDLKEKIRSTGEKGNVINRSDTSNQGDRVFEAAKKAIYEAVRNKPRQHCFEAEEQITEHRQMVQIGG